MSPENDFEKIRLAVVGAGQFGRQHMRVIQQNGWAELVAVADVDPARAQEAASLFGCEVCDDLRQLEGKVDAAIVAVPTTEHAEVGCRLLESGLDVLVEKPIAADLASAQRLIQAAEQGGRILQVGQLERFNPAVIALQQMVRMPLFFEVHRLSVFTPRSLDVDVVLDLMIHDIDVVLTLVGRMPEEIRAAGISVLTPKVDIASVRLAFPGGCVANLTASRVSTERVRKLRLFQPRQYISLDYARQHAASLSVTEDHRIASKELPVERGEPLELELRSFCQCVATRTVPRVTGEEASRDLEVALTILDKIEEHTRVVAQSLTSGQ